MRTASYFQQQPCGVLRHALLLTPELMLAAQVLDIGNYQLALLVNVNTRCHADLTFCLSQ